MNGDEITRGWQALAPTREMRRRMDGRVTGWLEAHDVSLAGEWLALFRVAPVRTAGLVTVGALSIMLATPVIWLARALL
jgi:hypothetical protein